MEQTSGDCECNHNGMQSTVYLNKNEGNDENAWLCNDDNETLLIVIGCLSVGLITVMMLLLYYFMKQRSMSNKMQNQNNAAHIEMNKVVQSTNTTNTT
eukprot:380935_1